MYLKLFFFLRILKGISTEKKKRFCSKSLVGVCIKLFQSFKVSNSLISLNNVHFVSAFKFPARRHVLVLQSLMGDYDVLRFKYVF